MKLFNSLLANTHSGDYTTLLDIIGSELEGTDAAVSLQALGPGKANLMALWGKPRHIVNCHMDTVPPTGSWSYPPYDLTREGGRLYGLGTSDTKGNLYALLEAVKEVEPVDTMLLFSVDEESGDGTSSGVAHFLSSPLARGVEDALVCEPTDLEMVTSHKGYCSFELVITTTGGHSSRGGALKNAIVEASGLVPYLREHGFNVGMIRGGGPGNVVPSSCTLKLSKRSNTHPAEVRKELESTIGGTNASVKARFTGPPLGNSPTHPLARSAGVTRTHPLTGCRWSSPTGTSVDFWTEAALFGASGIPAVVFGAGKIEQAHSPDEYVDLSRLEGARKHFMEFMEWTREGGP